MKLAQFIAIALAWLAMALFSVTAYCQTLTWDGGANDNWSNNPADANWTGSAWNAGANAVFAASGAAATYSVTLLNNITAGNLLLSNDVTHGVSLTLSGNYGLTINGNAALQLGPMRSDAGTVIGAVTLNMAELSAFAYDRSTQAFRVGLRSGGTGSFASGTTVATVTLADVNVITASQLLMGDQTVSAGGGHSYLYLGRQNTINASTIGIAAMGRSSALMQFADGLTSATATFRGTTGGDSRVTTWNIGQVSNFTDNSWTAVVDLTAGSIDARVGTMTIGDANAHTSSGRAGIVDASFAMGAGTMDVTTLSIGRLAGSGSIHATGSFRGNGAFTINHANAQFTAGSINLATMNHTANGGTAGTISTTGLFHLENGTATITGGIVLGSNTTTKTAGAVTATVRQSAGTLNVSGGLLEGSNDGGAVASTVELLGGTATIAGGLSADALRVGFNGLAATATVTGGDVRIGDGVGPGLVVAHRTDATSTTSGSLNLANASSATINTGTLDVAYNQSTVDTDNSVTGVLTLSASGPNAITADLLRLGHIVLGSTGDTNATLALGETNTISVNTVVVGGDRAQGLLSIAAGGTLTLAGKSSGTAANLSIGANNGGDTDTAPTASHFNLAGGTLNATLGNLIIGQYTGAGAGSGKGRFTMDAGNVTASTVLLASSSGQNPGNTEGTLTLNGGSLTIAGNVTGGSGVSTVQVAGGTMTVGGNLQVDSLRVGYHASSGDATGRNASLTTSGNGSVAIGSETARTVLYVGYTDQNLTQNVSGTLDLSGSTSLTAYLNSFVIGQRTDGVQDYNGDATGTVILP
ncbi:MAG: hypothetical protein U1E05_02220, partial [Patescibacteria group bacterium]|nr:hypothetical protein [Patescibacteria group bacterium]